MRSESFDLYAKAIDLEAEGSGILPFVAEGPTSTPPVPPSTKENPFPWVVDGHYEDTTKKYEVLYGDPKAYLKQLMLADIAKKQEEKRLKKEAREKKEEEELQKLLRDK